MEMRAEPWPWVAKIVPGLINQMVIPQVVLTMVVEYFPLFAGAIATWMYYQELHTYKEGTAVNFDFIVVGGGSAGGVVAARLSELYNVLLLEAGGDPLPLTSVPAFAGLLVHETSHDWGYNIVQQKKASLALKPNPHFPRGKSLGGSGNLDWMIYTRGNPKDYDNWAKITGDPLWKYENLELFFKKMEDYDGHHAASANTIRYTNL